MIYACMQQSQNKNWRETPSNFKILVIGKNVLTFRCKKLLRNFFYVIIF